MYKDLRGSVEKIAQFMSYNLDATVVDKIVFQSTFDSMRSSSSANPDQHIHPSRLSHKDVTPFLRKGIIGDWKNHFTEKQSTRLDTEYAKRMTGSGLDFSYE